MDAVVRTATKQTPQWRRLLAREDEGGEKSNELVRHGTTGAALLGGPRRGHRGGGWRRRGRSGAERPRQRFGERKAQEEPGGADFFCAQARGSKGGRSCAAAEDGRGGSISSDEAHRRRQLLPTASSARSKKTGARPPWTRRGTRQAMIVQKQGPEQPISRKRHAVLQPSRGASAETMGREMMTKGRNNV